MTDCSDGVAIVSISSSVSRHVRSSGRETGDELDDELLGVSTMSEGVNPCLFLSNDTARSAVSKESPGAILARFGFAEGSKLCILRTVSKLYYALTQCFSTDIPHTQSSEWNIANNAVVPRNISASSLFPQQPPSGTASFKYIPSE
jgi:hypothetical protein